MGEVALRGVGRAHRATNGTDGIAQVAMPGPVSRADIDKPHMLAKAVLHLLAGNGVDPAATMILLEIAKHGHRHLEAVLFLVANARDIGDIGISEGSPVSREAWPPPLYCVTPAVMLT